MALSSAQAVVDQKQDTVAQAERDALTAKSRLDTAEADLADKFAIKTNRDLDKTWSKNELTQKEQAKAEKEKEVEDALCEVYSARMDVEDASTKSQAARVTFNAANSGLQAANDNYSQAEANLSNGTGSALEVAMAEETALAERFSLSSTAEMFKLSVDSNKSLIDILQLKLLAAKTAFDQDRLAGDDVAIATDANNRYEANARDANYALNNADKIRDQAYDDWQLKKQAVENAKKALTEAQEDTSDPKARQQRAVFDCGEAQDQLARCQVSATCDGGERNPAPVLDCGDLQQAAMDANIALQQATETRDLALSAQRDSEDAYTAAVVAEGNADQNYEIAKSAFETDDKSQRTKEQARADASAAWYDALTTLGLDMTNLSLAVGAAILASYSTAATWGLTYIAIALAIAAVITLSASAARSMFSMKSAMSKFDDAQNAVSLGKVQVVKLQAVRDDKEKLWKKAEADVMRTRAVRTAARMAFKLPAQIRDDKWERNNNAMRDLIDCEAKKAAMQ
jgi:hypothetical protein